MSAHARSVVGRASLAASSPTTAAVFKRLRIAALLYVLLFVAAAQFFTARHTTDWDAPLWVDIYAVAGDRETATRSYLDGLRSARIR